MIPDTLLDEINKACKAYEREALSLLKDMVLINSWSYNKQGVDKVAELIISFFEGISANLNITVFEQEKLGNHVVVSNADKNYILIVGHMDTVFPPDSGFDFFHDEGETIRGPGIIDMKGGLVVGMYAIKILNELGVLESIPFCFVFNSDEEIGSISSKDIILDRASKSICGFVLECGGLNGEVVTGRKGKLGIKVEIEGRAGHAGIHGNKKASAILEMAHKIIQFENLNNLSDDITCNVGVAKGGIAPNVIPKNASLDIDLRYYHGYNYAKLMDEVKSIVSKTVVAGVESRFKVVSERPAMEQNEKNKRLFGIVKECAELLGVEIKEELRHGVSDANFIASCKVAVIDGLGPCGDMDHSEKEYMVKESFVDRMRLFSLLLYNTVKKYEGGWEIESGDVGFGLHGDLKKVEKTTRR